MDKEKFDKILKNVIASLLMEGLVISEETINELKKIYLSNDDKILLVKRGI